MLNNSGKNEFLLKKAASPNSDGKKAGWHKSSTDKSPSVITLGASRAVSPRRDREKGQGDESEWKDELLRLDERGNIVVTHATKQRLFARLKTYDKEFIQNVVITFGKFCNPEEFVDGIAQLVVGTEDATKELDEIVEERQRGSENGKIDTSLERTLSGSDTYSPIPIVVRKSCTLADVNILDGHDGNDDATPTDTPIDVYSFILDENSSLLDVCESDDEKNFDKSEDTDVSKVVIDDILRRWAGPKYDGPDEPAPPKTPPKSQHKKSTHSDSAEIEPVKRKPNSCRIKRPQVEMQRKAGSGKKASTTRARQRARPALESAVSDFSLASYQRAQRERDFLLSTLPSQPYASHQPTPDSQASSPDAGGRARSATGSVVDEAEVPRKLSVEHLRRVMKRLSADSVMYGEGASEAEDQAEQAKSKDILSKILPFREKRKSQMKQKGFLSEPSTPLTLSPMVSPASSPRHSAMLASSPVHSPFPPSLLRTPREIDRVLCSQRGANMWFFFTICRLLEYYPCLCENTAVMARIEAVLQQHEGSERYGEIVWLARQEFSATLSEHYHCRLAVDTIMRKAAATEQSWLFSSEFFSSDPYTIAEQWTLVELTYFKALNMFDVLRKSSTQSPPSLQTYSTYFNRGSLWVMNEIHAASESKKKSVISMFIKIASALTKYKNYDTCFTVCAGLGTTQTKLKKVWQTLSPGVQKLWSKLEEVTSYSKNFWWYRQAIDSSIPFIPVQAVYLKDLATMEEQPTFIGHSSGEQVVNFTKMLKISKIVHRVLYCQRSSYKNIEVIPRLFDLIAYQTSPFSKLLSHNDTIAALSYHDHTQKPQRVSSPPLDPASGLVMTLSPSSHAVVTYVPSVVVRDIMGQLALQFKTLAELSQGMKMSMVGACEPQLIASVELAAKAAADGLGLASSFVASLNNPTSELAELCKKTTNVKESELLEDRVRLTKEIAKLKCMILDMAKEKSGDGGT